MNVKSETGRLKKVLIHRPGPEVESMDPHTMEHQLYNDILPQDIAIQEHGEMEALLSCFSEVTCFKDILCQAIKDDREHLNAILPSRLSSFFNESGYSDTQIADCLIQGVRRPQNSFENICSVEKWLWKPLPNLFYSRDPGFVIGQSVIASKMHFPVRRPEAKLIGFALKNAYRDEKSFSLIEPPRSEDNCSVEGGDVHVLNNNHLIIGLSQRTSPGGIDWLARELMKNGLEELLIHAVRLPKERYCIHLDMVFSMVDTDTAIIYEPLIKTPLTVIEARYTKGKTTQFREYDSFDQALEASGIYLQYISCGGSGKSRQMREQWLSGANAFCLAPGIVIGYSCNSGTMQAFQKHGYQLVKAADVSRDIRESGVALPIDVVDYFKGQKTFISVDGIDLARGGGGIRCMTMPLVRDVVS